MDLPYMGPRWHIYNFTDGQNTMLCFFDDASRHRYFKNFPFISGIFYLEKKFFIENPIAEERIYYPKIKIKGKDTPITEHMKDFVFGDDIYGDIKKFNDMEFIVHDLNNQLFINLIPFENTDNKFKERWKDYYNYDS